MKTNDLQQQLDALRAKHAEAETKLVREHRILEALPDELDGLKLMVHLHGLYGTTASVHVEHEFYGYGREKRQPTLEDALLVAERFGGCAIRMVRDGCLSFQHADYIDALDEAKKQRWESETDVSPFLVKVSAFQHRTMQLVWSAPLPDTGEVIEFKFTLPLPQWLGSLDVQYKNYMGGRRVERCSFAPNIAAVFECVCDDEPLAQLAPSPIKWGRGSDDVPNDFTLYWHDLRDDRPTTPADFVRMLMLAEDVAKQTA